MSEEIYGKLAQAVVDGEPEDAEEAARQALEQGLDPLACINEGLSPGIDRVGELFATGEYFLPDLIMGGDAMKAALTILEPALAAGQEREILGRVVLGTVEGDLHEIGKTLVGTMLTANGFQVTDIGVDKTAAEFIDAVKRVGRDPDRRFGAADDDHAAAAKDHRGAGRSWPARPGQGVDRRRTGHRNLGRTDWRRWLCGGRHLSGGRGQEVGQPLAERAERGWSKACQDGSPHGFHAGER